VERSGTTGPPTQNSGAPAGAREMTMTVGRKTKDASGSFRWLLAPLPGRDHFIGDRPVVPLRSTTGYLLSSLRDVSLSTQALGSKSQQLQPLHPFWRWRIDLYPPPKKTRRRLNFPRPPLKITRRKVKITHPRVKFTHPRVKFTHPRVKITRRRVKTTRPRVKISRRRVKFTRPREKNPTTGKNHPTTGKIHPSAPKNHPSAGENHPFPPAKNAQPTVFPPLALIFGPTAQIRLARPA
jgi:hypothetical protein